VEPVDTATDAPVNQAAPAQRSPGWRWWPVVAMAIAAVALGAFYLASQSHRIKFGIFPHPPLYGRWNPEFSAISLLTLPASVTLAGIAWYVTSVRRLPTRAVLCLVIVGGVATAATISLVRGEPSHLTQGISTGLESGYYTADLHFIDEFGLRGFVEKHSELSGSFRSYNSKTHPSGILVLLWLLFRVIGSDHRLMIAAVIATLSMAAAICAWSIGRTLAGEGAGRIAAALTVAVPGMLMLSFGSMDPIFGTLMSAATALFMIAIYRKSLGWGIAAGAVLGLATFFTFATVFIGLAAAIAILIQRVGVRATARVLGGAAIGGLAVLALLRLGLGWDLLADYMALPGAVRSYDPYWIVGSQAAWLIFAGVPLAGIGIAGLVVKVPGARRPVLPTVLIAVMLVWASLPSAFTHLRPGEVERTWAFLYPILAACAAPMVDRWTADKGKWRSPIIAGLILISVAQAVLIQSLWDNRF
jgi:Dolichyl-phosphate-mannose-protein mannosyltransferase